MNYCLRTETETSSHTLCFNASRCIRSTSSNAQLSLVRCLRYKLQPQLNILVQASLAVLCLVSIDFSFVLQLGRTNIDLRLYDQNVQVYPQCHPYSLFAKHFLVRSPKKALSFSTMYSLMNIFM